MSEFKKTLPFGIWLFANFENVRVWFMIRIVQFNDNFGTTHTASCLSKIFDKETALETWVFGFFSTLFMLCCRIKAHYLISLNFVVYSKPQIQSIEEQKNRFEHFHFVHRFFVHRKIRIQFDIVFLSLGDTIILPIFFFTSNKRREKEILCDTVVLLNNDICRWYMDKQKINICMKLFLIGHWNVRSLT